MAQQDETGRPTATMTLNASSVLAAADAPTESLSIFSAPGIELVFQWWADSNRRWSERNRQNGLVFPAIIHPEAQ